MMFRLSRRGTCVVLYCDTIRVTIHQNNVLTTYLGASNLDRTILLTMQVRFPGISLVAVNCNPSSLSAYTKPVPCSRIPVFPRYGDTQGMHQKQNITYTRVSYIYQIELYCFYI